MVKEEIVLNQFQHLPSERIEIDKFLQSFQVFDLQEN